MEERTLSDAFFDKLEGIEGEDPRLFGDADPIDHVDWKELVDVTDKGAIRAIQLNVCHALRHAPVWRGVLGYDRFKEAVIMRRPAPWVSHVDFEPRQWTDADDLHATNWAQGEGIYVGVNIVAGAVQAVATENAYDSLADWLRGLRWDGTSRADAWLIDYCGAADTPYVRAVGAKFLIAAARRGLRPGCKFDEMLILEGEQGVRKSTAFAVLGGAWFNETLSDMGTKDSREGLRGSWIVEVAELDAMSRRDASQFKAFLATREDRYRPAYGRRDIVVPRRCVFAGTYNPDGNGYIKDPTGGRRFWPVEVKGVKNGQIDTEGLAAVRDQLFAEAVARIDEDLYLTGAELDEAKVEQSARAQKDDWEDEIGAYLVGATGPVTTAELLKNVFGRRAGDISNGDTQRVGRALRSLGYHPRQVLISGVRTRIYERRDDAAQDREGTVVAFDPRRNVFADAKNA